MSEQGFYEGDKVRCVNEYNQIKEGNVYTIEEYFENDDQSFGPRVNLKETSYGSNYKNECGEYKVSRFEKVEQEFEVGDRVRVVRKTYTPCEKGDLPSVGHEFEIKKITDFSGRVCDEIDDNSKLRPSKNYWYWDKRDLELISKGEGTMDNVDAIAVEVDDVATLDYLKKLAKGSEFKIDRNTEGSSHGFYGFTKTGDYCADPMTFHWIGSDSTDYLDRHGYTEIDLDNELGKLKNFLEQNKQEPPSLNGNEAEVKVEEDGVSSIDYHITVGCWEGSLVDLIEFKRRCENIGIVGGDDRVETALDASTVDIEELFQFIEDLQDYIDNQ